MEDKGIRLGIGGEAQRINAALAVAVAHTYLHHTQQGTQVRRPGKIGLRVQRKAWSQPMLVRMYMWQAAGVGA